MAKSGASKGAKKIKPFDEQNTKLAMGKDIQKIPTVSITEQIRSGERLDRKRLNDKADRARERYLEDFGSKTSVYGQS
tara:strand:+ start:10842 stop:11075 length:234 start_codon:yes stop_codon:yes gene_type:complete